MSKERRRFQFGLRALLLWTLVLALYCGLVVGAESTELEWLVVSLFPVLILGLRLTFGPWIACHVSAVGAGVVLALRVFFPSLPTSAFEVQYAFIEGCGFGYAVWLVVELICQGVKRADRLLDRRGRE